MDAINFSLAVTYVWRRQWQPTPVLLPGKSHGWRSLVGCSPRGREESDTTEWLDFHFSLSCMGEGNGNPLQCSCLENPGAGEPGGLPSMGSRRVGHDWSDSAVAAFHYVPHLLYPLVYWWTLRLFTCFSYCEWCCYEQRGVCIFFNYSFVHVYTQEWDCWVIW